MPSRLSGFETVSLPIQRAHAVPANGMGRDIEASAKRERLRSIENLIQRFPGAQMPDRPVEEAGAHSAVGLDHRGGPRRITGRRLRIFVLQVTPKMLSDSP